MRSALVISTYNWPEALGLVLQSLKKQTYIPEEIFIADDGSTQETKSLIETFNRTNTIKLIHIWHKDDGFRKSHILNKAIAQSKSDYIIQVDGDCIMHPNFIEDHISSASKGVYLYGSRVNIQKHFLDELFISKKTKFHVFSKGIKKRTRTLRIPFLAYLFKKQSELSSKYRGCNTSYFKVDFLNVNGYNEAITGWGREDSEFALRLHNNGVMAKRLRYKGIVFHIFHIEKSKDNLPENTKIQQETKSNKIIWAKNGVDKYLRNISG